MYDVEVKARIGYQFDFDKEKVVIADRRKFFVLTNVRDYAYIMENDVDDFYSMTVVDDETGEVVYDHDIKSDKHYIAPDYKELWE